MNFTISSTEPLKGLIPHTKEVLIESLEERVEMKIEVPDGFLVDVTFCKEPGYIAAATKLSLDDSTPKIGINTLEIFDSFETEENIDGIFKFFNYGNLFFAGDENLVIHLLTKPNETIKKFEETFGRNGVKKFKKQLFYDTGITYEKYVELFKNEHTRVSGKLETIIPFMTQEIINRKELYVLRHELDHLALNNTAFSRNIAELMKQKEAAYKNPSSTDYASLCLQYLDRFYEFSAMVEIRGLFFDYVQLRDWKLINYDAIKSQVYMDFHRNYIEGTFIEDFMDIITDIYYEDDKINDDTANYLMQLAGIEEDDITKEYYKFEPKNLQYKIINEILYDTLPKLKQQLSINARLCADVFGNVYQNKPYLFNKAKEAENFHDYLRICKE
ncbi:hypothetical protein JXM83_05030 [Candidatus Woesearchaeota archaeon]|nr:hypothetical protein [Candidatus Woesearchaeota archaeon]